MMISNSLSELQESDSYMQLLNNNSSNNLDLGANNSARLSNGSIGRMQLPKRKSVANAWDANKHNYQYGDISEEDESQFEETPLPSSTYQGMTHSSTKPDLQTYAAHPDPSNRVQTPDSSSDDGSAFVQN
jgi:hypothetical protein